VKTKRAGQSGFFNVRALVAFVLCLAGVVLAMFSFTPLEGNRRGGHGSAEGLQRYMPVPGGHPDDLNRMEEEWNNRLTYPTGIFDPAWVRAAAIQDSLITRAVPAGVPLKNRIKTATPLALNSNSFTPLGPAPLNMNGCSGCYNYSITEGRVNTIAIDPLATNVAYLGSVGGGVWKTTNCCSGSTSWSAVTDDPLLATISVDSVTIDPQNHNTIYAGTGDLNYGSFSMGSQGILKSTDAGATWTLLGANVFTESLPEPAGQFPQYQAVGKVRVDPRNSNNVVAGTKTGLYFSYDSGNNWTGPCTTNNFSTQRQDITGLELINTSASTRIIAAVGVRGFATTVQYNLNQNGANGIYAGTLPASGCPGDFAPIATNANGWTGMNPASGTAYVSSGVGDQLGRIDIAVAPSNSNYVYAQVQSITPNSNSGCGSAPGCQLGAWRTTDGGTTWIQIPGSPGASLKDCTASAGDYPQNWYDQGIAIDPNNPDRAFFDTFEVWFWDGSNAATQNLPWNDITCGYGTTNNGVHVDQHALAFVPGSSSILLAGNDGGVHGMTNANIVTGATDPTWFNMDTGLNTIEFYSGDISGNFATSPNPQANGGAQDNGASSVSFSGSPTGPVQWQMGIGGDGFYARIDPVGTGTSLRFFQGNNGGHVNRCISNCTASGASWTDVSGGWLSDTQSFVLPYDIFHGGIPGGDDCPPAAASGGCGNLIVGSTRVWETTVGNSPGTPTWYVTNNPSSQNMTKQTLGNRSFIDQVKYSPKYQSVAIVGTNDGNVWMGFNLGTGFGLQANWVNVTGSNATLPNRPVLGISLDPSVNAANVPVGYAAVGGFNANTPTTPGHLFQVTCAVTCGSFTWTDKTGNLPDIPVDSVIVNPKWPQQVFAGTDWGLYYTDNISDASPTWNRFENGMPHSMVWDLQIDRGSTTLSVWTRSRGAYVWPLPSAPPRPPRLVNISTRGLVQTGDNVMIGGFVISGTQPKKVIIHAGGPSLAQFGLAALSDPNLQLYDSSGAVIAKNDNWQTTEIFGIITSDQVSDIQNSGHAPSEAADSAIIVTLAPGAYTAIVSGVNGATGIGIVEVFDLDTGSRLVNISTRGLVQTGDNVLIGGFVISGTQPEKVIIHAGGPSLAQFGLAALSDPNLQLYDSSGAVIAKNDNWQTTEIFGIITSDQVSDIQNSGHAPSEAADSAIIVTLDPGAYTAIVSGVNGATGIGIVEVFDLQ
jgi:hypothetical protein